MGDSWIIVSMKFVKRHCGNNLIETNDIGGNKHKISIKCVFQKYETILMGIHIRIFCCISSVFRCFVHISSTRNTNTSCYFQYKETTNLFFSFVEHEMARKGNKTKQFNIVFNIL